MKRTLLLAATVFSAFTCGAYADSFVAPKFTGMELKNACENLGETPGKLVLNEQPFDAGLCLGYTVSFLDSWFFRAFFTPKPGFCMPPGVGNPQIIVVVKKWLNDHPEKLNEYAYQNISDALSTAFPCKAK